MARPTTIERLTKPCHNCGKPVTRRATLDSPRWFCSHRCFTSSKEHGERIRQRTLERHPDALLTVHCLNCGQQFERHKSKVQRQASQFCSVPCRRKYQADVPIRQVNSNGYVLLYVGRDYPGATKTGHLLEHRKVMSELLGRPLLDEENVHHLNGDRADNSPTNLELWSRSQPHGQRVEDKVRWARQILALYGDLIPE